MKFQPRRALLVVVGFLSGFQFTAASTNCTQKFEFLGLSPQPSGSVVFWIGEDVGGECEGSYIMQVAVRGPECTVTSSRLAEFEDWQEMREAVHRLELEPAGEVSKGEDGSWHLKLGRTPARFTIPARDDELERRLQKRFPGGIYLGEWHEEQGRQGISLPLFEGAKAELVCFSAGLYVGYEAAQVYFFPKSRFLLIFAHQPRTSVGGDTMHGVLIFRLAEEEAPEDEGDSF